MAHNRSNPGISSVTLAELLSGTKPSHVIPNAQQVIIEKCVGTKCYAFLNYDISKSVLPPGKRLQAFVPGLEKDGILFGVMLVFSVHRWHASFYSEAAKIILRSPAYQINERWIENLVALVKNEILPLLCILDRPFLSESQTQKKPNPLFSGTRNTLRAEIINEIRTRCHADGTTYKNNLSTSETLTEWTICQEWENWNMDGLSLKKRQEALITERLKLDGYAANAKSRAIDETVGKSGRVKSPKPVVVDITAIYNEIYDIAAMPIDKTLLHSKDPTLNETTEVAGKAITSEGLPIPESDLSITSKYFQYLLAKLNLKVDCARAGDYNQIGKAILRKRKLDKAVFPFWEQSVCSDKYHDPIDSITSISRYLSRNYRRNIDLSSLTKRYASVFPVSKQRDKKALVDQLWWWRDIYPEIESEIKKDRYKTRVSNWPTLLIKTFKDNWERSAFIYEMRARMSDRNHWDLFGKPWIQLNYSERAIVSILWPPEHLGAFKFRNRSFTEPVILNHNEYELNETISLLSPDGVISERIVQIVNEVRQAKGIPKPGRGKGRPKAPPWRALEFLDLKNYSTHIGLSGGDHSSIKNAEKIYQAACEEIGIEP